MVDQRNFDHDKRSLEGSISNYSIDLCNTEALENRKEKDIASHLNDLSKIINDGIEKNKTKF